MANSPVQDIEAGLPKTTSGNRRVTKYLPDLALQIVERLADGETLQAICKRGTGMPHYTTFMKWVAREPELQAAYMAARELSAMAMEEKAILRAEELNEREKVKTLTTAELRAAELVISQYRWSASRRDPKQYGDRANTQVTVPINITTSLDLGSGGKGSMGELPDVYTITVEPEKPAKLLTDPRRGPQKKVLTPRVPMDADIHDLKAQGKL